MSEKLTELQEHIGERVARQLFTDGRGHHYSHLSMDDAAQLGWCEVAIADLIQSEVGELEAQRDQAREEKEKAKRSQKYTQTWYAQHYGKLHDWARKRLPEQWRNEFFFCIANGIWGFADDAAPATLPDGTKVVPHNYFRVDTAEGQLILDQTKRAEEAELERDQARAALASYVLPDELAKR